MMSAKGLLLKSFVIANILLSFSAVVNAGTLIFTPGEDLIDYGDVYIDQMANKPVFTILASGGDCTGSIRPDFDRPAPAGQQTIAPPDFDLVSGDVTADIWIGILSTQPGDHNFYVKIASTCGTYYKTISFHCVGYGYAQGTVTDAITGAPLPTSTVVPGNPYLMKITMLGNGNYSASGYPGYHWLIAKAPGYTDQMVNVEIKQANTGTYNFQMVSALHVEPDNLKLGVKETASVQIDGTEPPYIITSSSPEIALATINENPISVTGSKVGNVVLTITDNAGNHATVTVQVVNRVGGLPALLLLLGEE